MTKLEPIWSTNLVKNPIWSTHLVNPQYAPIWSSNLVKSNLVRIDHIGSQICQSGQSNLVNSPIWSSQFGHPDQFGQSDYVNQTNMVKLFDQIGDETVPIWSTNYKRFPTWSPYFSPFHKTIILLRVGPTT